MASKEKIISIKPKGVTPKQYKALLLEINLMKRAEAFMSRLTSQCTGFKKHFKMGTNAYAQLDRLATRPTRPRNHGTKTKERREKELWI